LVRPTLPSAVIDEKAFQNKLIAFQAIRANIPAPTASVVSHWSEAVFLRFEQTFAAYPSKRMLTPLVVESVRDLSGNCFLLASNAVLSGPSRRVSLS